jgi:hypothetical protein
LIHVQDPERDYTGTAIFATGCAPYGAEEKAMFKPLLVYIVVTALFVAAGRPALAVDQTTIDQVVNVAKIGCLLGNEYTFDAKANGEITFTKLRPGAEAGLHTNIKEDPGAPGIIDQQLKLIASQQIRDCMKPYVQKLRTHSRASFWRSDNQYRRIGRAGSRRLSRLHSEFMGQLSGSDESLYLPGDTRGKARQPPYYLWYICLYFKQLYMHSGSPHRRGKAR